MDECFSEFSKEVSENAHVKLPPVLNFNQTREYTAGKSLIMPFCKRVYSLVQMQNKHTKIRKHLIRMNTRREEEEAY